MDLYGRSLELVRFENDRIAQAISLKLGAVRLSERFIEDRDAALPTVTEAAIRAHVHASISTSGFNLTPTSEALVATAAQSLSPARFWQPKQAPDRATAIDYKP